MRQDDISVQLKMRRTHRQWWDGGPNFWGESRELRVGWRSFGPNPTANLVGRRKGHGRFNALGPCPQGVLLYSAVQNQRLSLDRMV